MAEEARREKEALQRDKEEIIAKTHHSEKLIREKKGEVEAGQQQVEQLRGQLEEARQTVARKEAELGGYRRVTADNENALRELEGRLSDNQLRMAEMAHEVTRLGELVRERETRLEEGGRREEELRQALEERRTEAMGLQLNVERLGEALKRGEEQRGSFKVLMGEIEQLNAQLASKQSENSSLREEVLQLMDRIELIGQEQRRIMQLRESS